MPGVQELFWRQLTQAAVHRRQNVFAVPESSPGEDPAYYDRLIDAWAGGDTRAIEDLGLTPMKQVSIYLYDRLIVQRNRRWVETIAERMQGSGETVIVVGVGHLVGPDSVPALLRARGFTVEGP